MYSAGISTEFNTVKSHSLEITNVCFNKSDFRINPINNTADFYSANNTVVIVIFDEAHRLLKCPALKTQPFWEHQPGDHVVMSFALLVIVSKTYLM